MFRQMRRVRQQLDDERTRELLQNGTTGVLGLIGDEGYPYTVPVNYVLCDDKIIFHGAKSGHKYDSIRRCDKASFCLVADDEIVPEKLTDAYRSVIVFGRVRELTDPAERDAAARLLGLRFYQDPAFVDEEIRKSRASLACFELKIEHMTGKVGLELLKREES